MSSVIEDLKHLEDRILSRISELEANVAELEELRAVAARLGLLDGDVRTRKRARAIGSATASTRTRTRTGPAASATSASSSTRRERVLEAVAVAPGISVREVVAQLGVNRTSLYPVVRQLVSDGLLNKDGRGLWLSSR